MVDQNERVQDAVSTQQKQDADRRRYARTNYKLKARYLSEDGQERSCVVVNISAGGAMVKARHTPKLGEKVVLYIDEVGRFESIVVRTGKHTFAVRYQSRRAKTKRTADALIRVLNRGQKEPDRRIAPRIALDNPVMVTHSDGTKIDCSILDISLTGASLKIDPKPALGTELIVGRMKARVVRRHDMGVGVVFVGSTSHMEELLEKTRQSKEEDDPDGTTLATSFGKKASL